MLDRLLHALVQTKNEAADDLLLQALRLGVQSEQAVALDVLLQRKTAHGLKNLLGQYETLGEPLQQTILANLAAFHRVLAESGRGPDARLRLAAIKLIAIGRQGKLAYVLTENLHDSDDTFSKAGCEGIVALARWVATETRRLQKGTAAQDPEAAGSGDVKTTPAELTPDEPVPASPDSADPTYDQIIAQRPEIEAAVARAMNLHRGKHGQDLLRAALLLADWPGSRTLAIMQTARHGGQSAMIRRLQQPPHSEHVEAFLLVASRGHLRAHFG